MRVYTKSHTFCCGIDLNVRWMDVCVRGQQGEIPLNRELRICPEAFLNAIEPFRQNLVVTVEGICTEYWLS